MYVSINVLDVCVTVDHTYKLSHSAQDYAPAPKDHSHNTYCWTPYAGAHNLYSWRWAYRCPKHV